MSLACRKFLPFHGIFCINCDYLSFCHCIVFLFAPSCSSTVQPRPSQAFCKPISKFFLADSTFQIRSSAPPVQSPAAFRFQFPSEFYLCHPQDVNQALPLRQKSCVSIRYRSFSLSISVSLTVIFLSSLSAAPCP